MNTDWIFDEMYDPYERIVPNAELIQHNIAAEVAQKERVHRLYTNVCKHCNHVLFVHIPDLICPFSPTTYHPMTRAEYGVRLGFVERLPSVFPNVQ
jgi:hypothetical protein